MGKEKAHLGSDWSDPDIDTPTGTKKYATGNYEKITKPANENYYTATGAHEYYTPTDNNGQREAFPTYTNGETRQPIKISYGYNDATSTERGTNYNSDSV